MSRERRRYQRLVRPIEASFSGTSGATSCRIGDISWGGCFIQTVISPQMHQRTEITFPVGDETLTVQGKVVYVENGIGFAVQFDPVTPEQVQILRDLLGNPDL